MLAILKWPHLPQREWEGCSAVTYTLAWGFFFEKSQASPRSEIRTWPCSSNRILAGWGAERERETVILMTENTRDTIISIGNNVRDLTNSWLKNNFRPAAENSVWTRADKRRKKTLLSWLSSAVWQKKKKKKRDSKYYLHCSALFIEALKLFPDFQQNISVIMATSPNRGIGGKTEESWKHGWCESMALREYLWRCAGREGLILCHMSFFSLCCFLQLSTQRSDDETFI